MLYRSIRWILFLLPAETVHHMTLRFLQFICRFDLFRYMIEYHPPYNSTFLDAVTSRQPRGVGLAAGFDKNAEYLDALSLLGFHHIEIGTITPNAQTGNPKPRIKRIRKNLFNSMGFPNLGVEKVKANLMRFRAANYSTIIGANIGKGKWTPNDNAHIDYIICFQQLYYLVDYFTINVSSPNTAGLHKLQTKEHLSKILTELQSRNPAKKPIYVKISPNLQEHEILHIVEACEAAGAAGIVACNSYPSLAPGYPGGYSGKDYVYESLRTIRLVRKYSKHLQIIGCGGIFSADDAKNKMDCGANAVQIYTGLVFIGPKLIKDIAKITR